MCRESAVQTDQARCIFGETEGFKAQAVIAQKREAVFVRWSSWEKKRRLTRTHCWDNDGVIWQNR